MVFRKTWIVNDRHTKYLDLLETKVINFPKLFAVRVGALIVYKNKPIAFGQNSVKTDPFQAKFRGNPFQLHLHAEVNAIKKSLKKLTLEQIQKSTVYVVRLKMNNPVDHKELKYIWGMAKPCVGCQRALAEFGIKKIIYTTDDGCAFL